MLINNSILLFLLIVGYSFLKGYPTFQNLRKTII